MKPDSRTSTTGSLIRTIGNVARGLGRNLYQTQDTSPTLLEIGSKGQLLWQKTTASIFGPSSLNPNYGWDIDPHGLLNVGSLANPPQDRSYNVGAITTTGFDIATGAPVWSDPGMYNCEGTLEFLSAPVLCRFTGSVTANSRGAESLAGVALTLEGFDVQTGAVTWSQSVENVSPFAQIGNLAFVDNNHVVIEQNGRDVILNTTSGAIAPLPQGQILWCSKAPYLKVTASSGSGETNERAATSQYFGCTSAGVAVPGYPTTQPSVVGVNLDGKFFWPSAHGIAVQPAP